MNGKSWHKQRDKISAASHALTPHLDQEAGAELQLRKDDNKQEHNGSIRTRREY
jgi:hypothetical protein